MKFKKLRAAYSSADTALPLAFSPSTILRAKVRALRWFSSRAPESWAKWTLNRKFNDGFSFVCTLSAVQIDPIQKDSIEPYQPTSLALVNIVCTYAQCLLGITIRHDGRRGRDELQCEYFCNTIHAMRLYGVEYTT